MIPNLDVEASPYVENSGDKEIEIAAMRAMIGIRDTEGEAALYARIGRYSQPRFVNP